ncbi:acyl-[acyl-carrier-protein] thioesterase [Spirochaeta isovalerica]|uniref:Acyl-ACP thioesterase n=1 Tax=Spirochaeta isovalerica TaxID=150 RepID=A0A841R9D2_9SPIO|nr:acyl-ACP thioesterase domain-containing protein [Spirochaeta isovalerica]MBB6480386.1 acyl-ACP thioesterase [Spirochaeta isovalerica]
MNLKIQSERRVESFDADLHNKLKISSIFNYMQDIAAKHADELGVGYHVLQEKKIFWVLSWAKVEIEGPLPSYGESLTIETWAKGKHRLFYMRDFLLRNNAGEIIIRGTSAWLLLDAETKRLTDLNRMGLDLPAFPDEHALEEYPGKFDFHGGEAQISKRKVLYSDIDINKHVNNSRYIEFILDCYNYREHETGQVKALTISYKGETHFMDELEISRAPLPDAKNSDIVNAMRESDGKEIFNCLIEWK